MATKTVLLTSGTTWVLPADLDTTQNITVTCIGGGGGGRRPTNNSSSVAGGGGGGGGWSRSSVSVSGLTAGVSTTYIQIGAGGNGGTSSGSSGGNGGITWFNKSTNAAPTSSADGARANGGSGSTGTAGGAGGSTTGAIGTTTRAGGNGGTSGTGGSTGNGAGGGGSAGDDNATGGNGGNGFSTTSDGGGGGGGGTGGNGTSASSVQGRNGGLTYSGASGGSANSNAAGSAGTNGGGGGGGAGRNDGGVAFAGGAGGSGTETAVSPATFDFAYTSPGTYQFVVPAGVTSISGVTIGGGGGGAGGDGGRGSPNSGGGGGGLAYGDISVTPGETLTVTVGSGGATSSGDDGSAGGATTIARGATILLSGGGGQGGLEQSTAARTGGASTGTARIGGGTGGSSGAGSGSGGTGGGGAGGYSGNGGNGGGTGAGVAGSGGGGGGGGARTGTTAGVAGSGGGVDLYGVGSDGAGGTSGGGQGGGGSGGSAGTTSAGGAYGGGGGGRTDSSGSGVAGGNGAARIYWTTIADTNYGSGGGGGGGGGTNNTGGTGGAGGNGGLFGGGGGGGAQGPTSGNGGRGAQGAIIITYTLVPALTTAYWVGGTGTWASTSTANWASTSGGSGGAGYVDETSSVIFDSNSGTGTVTISGGICGNFTITSTASALTLAPSTGGLTIYGNVSTSSAGSASISGTGTITFAATTSKTITSGGEAFDCPVTFSGVGGTWVLQDALTIGNTRTTTLTNGTLNLNGQTLSTGQFALSGSATKALTSSTATTINLTRTVTATICDMSNVTGFTGSNNITFDATVAGSITKTINTSSSLTEANSPNFIVGGNSSTITFGGSSRMYNLTVTNTTCTVSNRSFTIFGSLNIQGSSPTFSNGAGTWTFAGTGSRTITTSGETLDYLFSFTGVGGSWALQGALTVLSVDLTSGTFDLNGFTVTITSSGISATGTLTRTLAFGTTGSFVLAGSNPISIANATNLNITGTPIFQTTSTATVNINFGATTQGYFTEANTLSLISTTPVAGVAGIYCGSSVTTLSPQGFYKDINLTGFTGTLGNNVRTIYGNLVLSTTTTITAGTNSTTFAATSGTKTITSNGRTVDFPVTFDGVGGTWQLQDALTVGATRATTLTNGTIDLNGFTLTTGTFSSTNSNTRRVQSTTAATIVPSITTATTVWNTGTSTNLTTSGNITVQITGNNAVTKTINSGTLDEANAFNFTVGGTGTTITFTANNTVEDLTITNSTCTVSNIALTIYGALNIQGTSPTLTAGASVWSFRSTTSKNLTTSGETLDFPITFNGIGGTWILQDAFTTGTSRTVTLSAGTLNLNNFTLTTGTFNTSNSVTRALAFGTGKVVSSTVSMSDSTNISITGTVIFEMTGTTVSVDLGSGAAAYWTELTSLNVTVGAAGASAGVYIPTGATSVTLSGYFKDVTLTGLTATLIASTRTIYGSWNNASTITFGTGGSPITTFAATSGTKTITTNGSTFFGTFQVLGVGATFQLQDALTINGILYLFGGTLDLNGFTTSASSFASSNTTNVRRLTSSTATTVILTATSGTVYTVNNVANLTGSNNVTFQITNNDAATKNISSDALSQSNSFNFTLGGNGTTFGFINSPTFYNLTITNTTCSINSYAITIYGNLNVQGTSPTLPSGTGTWTFAGNGSKTITTSGDTLNCPVTFNGSGGTWTLQDALTLGSTRTFTLTNGTFDANNFNVTIGDMALGAGTKTLTLGSGTWTVLGTSWNTAFAATGLTVSASTGTINMASASPKTFNGWQTWPTVNQGGAGSLTFVNGGTFGNITNTVSPSTVIFTSGTTYSINGFSLAGTPGNLVTLASSAPPARPTFVGAVPQVNISYVTLSNINATGTTLWQSLLRDGCVDGGGNSGWQFADCKPIMFFL